MVLKFFLQLSKGEQRRRFLEWLTNDDEHWKFSPSDAAERAYWKDYPHAFEDANSATSTKWAPSYIVSAGRRRGIFLHGFRVAVGRPAVTGREWPCSITSP